MNDQPYPAMFASRIAPLIAAVPLVLLLLYGGFLITLQLLGWAFYDAASPAELLWRQITVP